MSTESVRYVSEITSAMDYKENMDDKDRKKSKVTLLIVDDHPIFLDGVSNILLNIYPDATILKATTGKEALTQSTLYDEIDWIFLDLKLPDCNAIELLPKLNKLNLFASVIIVSSEDQPEVIDNVLTAGANGFLSKISEKNEFIKCIQQVEQGKHYVQESMRESLQHYQNIVLSELRHIQNNLSPRQHEVLALLSNGLSNSEIGRTLTISESTVKSHVSQLMTTLEADSRTHCVFEARRIGIIT